MNTYYILGFPLGSLYRYASPDGFTNSQAKAKRFTTEEQAWEFAFADRMRKGDTIVFRCTGAMKTPVYTARTGKDIRLSRSLGHFELDPASIFDKPSLHPAYLKAKQVP